MATPLDASKALLNRLGIPWSQNRLVGLVAFFAQEGGHWANGARYNPWNTTLAAPGATSMNGPGVKAYQNWAQGIDATARTMAQPNMRPLLDALRRDATPREFLTAVTATPWCPRFDGNGNPTGCAAYDNVNPEALFQQWANRQDSGATSLSTTTGPPWKTIAIAGGIFFGAAVAANYVTHGRLLRGLRRR